MPVLLSRGVGVMKAQQQKKLALAVLTDAAVNKSEGGQGVHTSAQVSAFGALPRSSERGSAPALAVV